MSIFEFIPFVVSVFIACIITVVMYDLFGLWGLLISILLGVIIISVGLVVAFYLASNPKGRKGP